MIPKTIHQIWIGPKRKPVKWMDTWRRKNPHMEYMLWTDYSLFSFQDKFKALIKRNMYAIVADIMRVEILYKYGGVYVDADSICIKSIEDAPFMDRDFFVGRDFYQDRRSSQTNRVANGTFGTVAGHPILKDYLNRIEGIPPGEYWRFGAQTLTDCLEGKDVAILPVCTFTPVNWDGRLADVEGEIYAKQLWGSTKKVYE